MEFSVEDGVRLVRKLTNKVMSAMKVVPPGNAHSNDILNNESCLDTEDTTRVQIGHPTTKSNIKQPDFLETWSGITENVHQLVKHSDVLSSANMLPINVHAVDKLVRGQGDNATYDINAPVPIQDNVDTQIKRNESSVAHDETSSPPSKQRTTVSISTDTFITFQGKVLAPKHLGLIKTCISVNPTNGSFTKPDLKSDRTSETCITDQINCKSDENNIDKDLDEFEHDITFLEGCLNKTSTPSKYIVRSRDTTREEVFRNGYRNVGIGKDVLPNGSGIVGTGKQVFPSGSGIVGTEKDVFPSGSGIVGTGKDVFPSGSGIVGTGKEVFPSGSGIVGTEKDIFPSGFGIVGTGKEVFPSGSGIVGTEKDVFPSGSEIVGTGKDVFPSGSGIVGTGKDVFPSGSGIVGTGKDVFPSGSGIVGTGKDVFRNGFGIVDTRKDVFPNGSGIVGIETESGVHRATLISKTYNVRKPPRSPSPRRKTSYSPYRKHLHALSPFVRAFGHLSKPQSSIPSLNENTTSFGLLNNSPQINTCTLNDDLRLLDTSVDFPHRPLIGDTSSNSQDTRINDSEADFPPSGRGSVLSILSRVKSGARRSLFGESAGLSRFLPTLPTDKPLGYDAYQQFINVTKTDVLPKYYFENEDEEAVYYLKVKYLDDNDTNPYHTAL